MLGIGVAHGPRGAGDDVLLGSVWLAPGDVLRIGDGRDLLVEALEGSFWLTQEGEGCDVDVCERGSFRLDRNGCALLTTRRGGVLGLRAPSITRSLATRIVLDRAASADRVVIQAVTSRRPGPLVRLVEFCRWCVTPRSRAARSSSRPGRAAAPAASGRPLKAAA